MTEEDYLQKIDSLYPESGEASLEVIALADQAVQAFPLSTQLWCLRGNLIQLGPYECPHELGEALESYQRALEIDPTCGAAYESIAHYLDVIEDEPEQAALYFAKAAQYKSQ